MTITHGSIETFANGALTIEAAPVEHVDVRTDRRTEHERIEALEDMITRHVEAGRTLSQAHVLIVDKLANGTAWELRQGVLDLRVAMKRARINAPDRARLWQIPKPIDTKSTLQQQLLQVRAWWLGLLWGMGIASVAWIAVLVWGWAQ